VGKQPILTFVTVGELAQWTKLRYWGPRNLAMLDSWLADKPVIPGSKAIAAVWDGLSAAAIQRGRPRNSRGLVLAPVRVRPLSRGGSRQPICSARATMMPAGPRR
jgi:hypothetical protein